MELSHSLTLNEEALAQLPAAKRPVFVFEWLRFLDKVLVATSKADIKECQKKIIDQLLSHMQDCPGPPARKLIARCLATLFSVGDTFLLFEAVDRCNDVLKNKDDSPSYLPVKLVAICCLGGMYEKLGRMMGRSYEDTVHLLVRALKNAESQARVEIMSTLEKVCAGMGGAIAPVHREVYKAAKHCLVDRVMAVRCAASRCLLELASHAAFLHAVELENLAALCFRAFDSSNYEARCAVAKLLGSLVALTQKASAAAAPAASAAASQAKSQRTVGLEEALAVLMSGFVRGGLGFLKGTGEIIKGSSGANREVRVGVTYAYVVFAQALGSQWLERNCKTFLNHVLSLTANSRAAASHVDAVYSRKCVNFILRSTVGKMLSEKAQVLACREIANVVLKEMSTLDPPGDSAKELAPDSFCNQHLLVCALQEMGCLVVQLGTSARDLISEPNCSLMDVAMGVCVHPCYACRLASAWCLRCICAAVPSQITPLIDRCIAGIDNLRTSPEAVSGYSVALAAVVSSIRFSPLGVPHTKAKIIFNTAEELLRSASQNSRLSMNRTQAGWLLIGAIMGLGVPAVRSLLPRMLLLWRNSFPRSAKELESEKARGDSFTWQVTLEGRAGSLSAIHSFVRNCPELATGDVVRRLLTPIESALAMLININSVLKTYGQQLKASAAMVRLRLYETLLVLNQTSFENSYTYLLRMLVAEFTLADNPANTTTSLLRTVCHADDSVILGTWLQETDHRVIEDQMEPKLKGDGDHLQPSSASGSGALEHDSSSLFWAIPAGEIPGPLPLGVAVIDASVLLFGQIFPRVTNKHRLQMLEHFAECIKHAKSSRQEAVQINVFTALLSGLRGLSEAKTSLGPADIKTAATSLIMGAITSPNPILRCAAGESIGRLAQVVADFKFTAELAQASFDKLKSARDIASRTGHSLALGCLHRYVGGLGSSQHLGTSVSILLALAQDATSPMVQVWALHALALISDSGGPMFRGYVEPTLSLALKLLLTVPQSHVDVHQCIGKVLSALISTVGPELQCNTPSVCATRSSLLSACAIMQDEADPLVQAEATGCLQQLHLFAPKHVNLHSLVPTLCRTLSSDHLILRKAAISCLRQLAQKEAKEVCDHAVNIAGSVDGIVITESGLPGALFDMLNTETDVKLIKDIHDTLICMLQMLAADNLAQWLGLCKDVLTITTESNLPAEEGAEGELDDDQAEFHAGEDSAARPAIQPRWPTRVFAAECVRKIIACCEQSPQPHFDIVRAKQKKGDFLVLHISDLVRMAFVAATSDSDQLRLDGLHTLKTVIRKFCHVPEPEFPGHLLLEQFQAQVGAALRPAFAADTSSLVTAVACEVCSTWIASNVARNLNDLRRVHQLLVSSLEKLQTKTDAAQLYNESMATLERLVILKAWSEVYVVAMRMSDSSAVAGFPLAEEADGQEKEYRGDGLLVLVQPELGTLSKHWLAALKDYALLSLPPEFASQLPHEGGAFYSVDTVDSCRSHYLSAWHSILYAAALWLNDEDFRRLSESPGDAEEVELNEKRFHLLFGICVQNLCSTRCNEEGANTVTCLCSLHTLLSSRWARRLLAGKPQLCVELSSVLHRLILTVNEPEAHLVALGVLRLVLSAVAEDGALEKEFVPGRSVVFVALEVCLCACLRHVPDLNPLPDVVFLTSVPTPPFSVSIRVLAAALACLELLPGLCTVAGRAAVYPSYMYITAGVLKELASREDGDSSMWNNAAMQAVLRCYQTVLAFEGEEDEEAWRGTLQSSLARIVEVAKTSSGKLNEIVILMAIGVFVLKAPEDVVSAPNLLYPCVNFFKDCLQSSNAMVKLKCVQTTHSIFTMSKRSVAIPYIYALAPRLLESLYKCALEPMTAEVDLKVIQETINAIEALVSLVEPDNRTQMLGLLLAALSKFLLDSRSQQKADKLGKQLYECTLQWLMKIGLKYSQEFKVLLQSSAELRRAVEDAAKVTSQAQQPRTAKVAVAPSLQQPTIKLKTDFSNFS